MHSRTTGVFSRSAAAEVAKFVGLHSFGTLAHALFDDVALDSGPEPERSEATDRFGARSRSTKAAGRGCDMSAARYQSTADLLDPWGDDVQSGKPPALYQVGAGEPARIEIGPGLVTLLGGAPGKGQDRLDDATGHRRAGALAGSQSARLQRRNEPADSARPPAC